MLGSREIALKKKKAYKNQGVSKKNDFTFFNQDDDDDVSENQKCNIKF